VQSRENVLARRPEVTDDKADEGIAQFLKPGGLAEGLLIPTDKRTRRSDASSYAKEDTPCGTRAVAEWADCGPAIGSWALHRASVSRLTVRPPSHRQFSTTNGFPK
jgi:hypothetical protein